MKRRTDVNRQHGFIQVLWNKGCIFLAVLLVGLAPVSGLAQPVQAQDAESTYTLTVSGGDNQAGLVGAEFAEPLAVNLSEGDGSPVAGADISFSAPGTGASASLSAETVTTDAQGQASVTATANGILGSYSVTASSADGQSVSFTLSNTCAETIEVSSPADDGAGSLRQALAQVCAGGTITFTGDMTIQPSSRLVVDHDLTLDGGSHGVTIDGQQQTGLMQVETGVNAVVQNLSLVNGYGVYSDTPFDLGAGAINNLGTLSVVHSQFTGNRGGYGGAIGSEGSLTISESSFSGNSSTYAGGAIYMDQNAVSLTVQASRFSGNSSGDSGGAINTFGEAAEISDSTFSDNSTASQGGALRLQLSSSAEVSGNVFVSNRTSDNGIGGAIYSQAAPEALFDLIVGNTFVDNTAGSGGAIARGGGNTPVLKIYNNTFSGNTLSGARLDTGTVFNISGAIGDIQNNLILGSSADSEKCTNVNITHSTGANNLINVWCLSLPGFIHQENVLTGPLGDYGGNTQTIPLLPGSAAIDAGNAAACPAVDQRGVTRPQGAACDIGAYEYIPLAQTITFGPLAGKTYGDADFDPAAAASSGLAVTYTASGACSIESGLVHLTGAGSCTVTASQGGDADYAAAPDAAQTFAIEPATADCSVTPYNVTYDGLAHTATGECLGIHEETLTGLDLSATGHTNAGVWSDAWTFSDPAGNYLNASGKVTDVIGKADQAIDFSSIAQKTYGDADFDLDATASSALAVSYSATGACSVAGGTIHLTGAGTCTVTASQGGNENYNPASDSVQSFSILQKALTITANDKSVAAGTAWPAFDVTYAGFVNGDTASVLGGTLTCTSPATNPTTVPGSFSIQCSGLTSANYAIAYVDGALTVANSVPVITSAAFTATAVGCPVNGGNNVALKVSFTDLSSAGPWSADVDWNNDGIFEEHVANVISGFHVNHSYTTNGLKTATVKVTNHYGGVSTALSATVKVLYKMSMILQPFRPDGMSIWKHRSTLPVKITITTCAGVSVPNLKPIVGTHIKSSADPNGSIDEASSTSAADTGNEMRYDETSQQYIFNFTSNSLVDGSALYYMYVHELDSMGVDPSGNSSVGQTYQQFGLKLK
jgi:predicted outer membrane repeat protein